MRRLHILQLKNILKIGDVGILARAIIHLIVHPEIVQGTKTLLELRITRDFSCYLTVKKTEELCITLPKK